MTWIQDCCQKVGQHSENKIISYLYDHQSVFIYWPRYIKYWERNKKRTVSWHFIRIRRLCSCFFSRVVPKSATRATMHSTFSHIIARKWISQCFRGWISKVDTLMSSANNSFLHICMIISYFSPFSYNLIFKRVWSRK